MTDSTSSPDPSTTDSTEVPIMRMACFKFHPTVTPAQKSDRTAAFLALYAKHPDLLLTMPTGGRPLDTPLNLTGVKREEGWDTGFFVVFKDLESKKKFDVEPGHDQLKKETDPLLEQVFVYDFINQENLGW